MEPEDYDQRACPGQIDLFYGPYGERPEARQVREARARRLCMSCPVRAACLDDDLRSAWKLDGIHGFRAGMTEDERRAEWKRRSSELDLTMTAAAYYDLLTA